MMMKKLVTLLKAIPRAERRASLQRSAAEVRAKREALVFSHVFLLVGLLWAYRHPGVAIWLLDALMTGIVIAVWTVLITQFIENLKQATAHQIAWGDEHVN